MAARNAFKDLIPELDKRLGKGSKLARDLGMKIAMMEWEASNKS